MSRVVLIGLGGIGTCIVEPLCRTLVYSKSPRTSTHVVLVDGDAYEEKNRTRQRFTGLANKAEVSKEWLTELFPELTIEAKPYFIDEDNAFLFIKNGDVVFLAVDNHKTRKQVSDYAGTLSDIFLISGGNELYTGDFHIYERKGGVDLKPPFIFDHPEIEFPEDKNPAELSCQELSSIGGTQFVSMNFSVAAAMLASFTLWLEGDAVPYYEGYIDMKTGNARALRIEDAPKDGKQYPWRIEQPIP